MATNAPVADPKPAPVRPLVPPEEQFWVRYSPHNEAPLSGVTSFGLHLLAIPLIALIVWVMAKWDDDDKNKEVPVDVVMIDDPTAPVDTVARPGGGGGHRKGSDKGPNRGSPEESGGSDKSNTDKKAPLPSDPPPLTVAQRKQVVREIFGDEPGTAEVIDSGQVAEALKNLGQLDRDVRDKLRKNVNPGAGRGGSGSGGGKDKGTDKGEGGGRGEGTSGTITQRERRMLRWAMTFNTLNGTDYRNQLRALGATVAVPLEGETPGNEQRWRIYRDLGNPSSATEDDISKVKQIYWIDDKPESVRALCTALQVRYLPARFVAFFPPALEKKLLQIELEKLPRLHPRAKLDLLKRQLKQRGIVIRADEDLIQETKFDVVRAGGSYTVVVRDVILRQ